MKGKGRKSKRLGTALELTDTQLNETDKVLMYLGGRTDATITSIVKETKIPIATMEYYLDYLERIGMIKCVRRGTTTKYSLADNGNVISQKEYDTLRRTIRSYCAKNDWKYDDLTILGKETVAARAICDMYDDDEKALKVMDLFIAKEAQQNMLASERSRQKAESNVKKVMELTKMSGQEQYTSVRKLMEEKDKADRTEEMSDMEKDMDEKDEKTDTKRVSYTKLSQEEALAREDAVTLYIMEHEGCTTTEIMKNYPLLPSETRMSYSTVANLLRSITDKSGSYITRRKVVDNGNSMFVYSVTTVPLDVSKRIQERKDKLGDIEKLPVAVKVTDTSQAMPQDAPQDAAVAERRKAMEDMELTEYVFTAEYADPVRIRRTCTRDQAYFAAQLLADMTHCEVSVSIERKERFTPADNSD